MKLLLAKFPLGPNLKISIVAVLGLILSCDSFTQNLPKLMNDALLSHPSISSQKAQMQAAEIGIETAKWQYFPTPSVNTERVNASTRDPFYGGDKNVTTARLQQPLWTNGRLTAGKEKAQATLS